MTHAFVHPITIDDLHTLLNGSIERALRAGSEGNTCAHAGAQTMLSMLKFRKHAAAVQDLEMVPTKEQAVRLFATAIQASRDFCVGLTVPGFDPASLDLMRCVIMAYKDDLDAMDEAFERGVSTGLAHLRKRGLMGTATFCASAYQAYSLLLVALNKANRTAVAHLEIARSLWGLALRECKGMDLRKIEVGGEPLLDMWQTANRMLVHVVGIVDVETHRKVEILKEVMLSTCCPHNIVPMDPYVPRLVCMACVRSGIEPAAVGEDVWQRLNTAFATTAPDIPWRNHSLLFLEMAAVFHEFKYNFPIDVGPLLDASSPIYQEWIPYGLRRDYRHRMTTRQTNPAEGQYRKCSGCGEERLCLLRCSACDTHSLCSTECHRKHWPCLKMECKAARRAQAAAVTCNAAG